MAKETKRRQAADYARGFHAVRAALEAGHAVKLCVDEARVDARMQELIALADSRRVPVVRCDKLALSELTDAQHQGAVAELAAFAYAPESQLWKMLEGDAPARLFLLLDQVQDPHNLGACLRSAEAAGVDAVILPKHDACGINHSVRKAAAGAAERLLIVRAANLARCMQQMQQLGVWITGASADAPRTIYQLDFSGHIALALGGEGAGLRRLTLRHCDQLGRIPMVGGIGSLNVSVATGVLLFELRRRLA